MNVLIVAASLCTPSPMAPTSMLTAAEQQKVVLADDFAGEGHFSFRTLFANTPQRTWDWAIKITDLPDGRLLMVWCSTAGAELSPTNCLWTSYSADDGKTWDPPKLFAKSTEQGNVANTCCYTHAGRKVFIFYNEISGKQADLYRVAYQTSDNGVTGWSARRYVPVGDTKIAGLLSSPIRLRDGTIVLPVYVDVVRGGKHTYVGAAARSTDGGENWLRGETFDIDNPRGVMEPTFVELSDGQLYCVFRTATGWLYECRSSDGGKTWTKPVKSRFPSPEACPILWRLASGGVILVWDNNTLSGGSYNPRYPIFAALSSDDTKTWPVQKMIDTASGIVQLSNHGVFQTRSGTILVPVPRWLGFVKGAEQGAIELARFDEAWLRSQVSPEKWDSRPAATGGIRLDPGGVLLVSSADRDQQTLLAGKMELPARCTLQFQITDVARHPDSCNGVFFGSPPWEKAKPWLCVARSGADPKTPAVLLRGSANEQRQLSLGRYYESTTVRIRRDGNRIEYSDSDGAKSGWVTLPNDLVGPLPWGFFSRNAGSQGRVQIGRLRVFAND
jgi:hypothetical protein